MTIAIDLVAAAKEDLAQFRTQLNDMATPEMLKEIARRLEYSVGNEQNRVKSTFDHAFLTVVTQVVTASNARVKTLEGIK